MFAADTDVAFASHHWPTWGTENVLALRGSSETCTPICTIRPFG
jgi:alkyl sulfatase BDS1-like metallo-beta-lactamase superfamily hydrolase